MEKKAVDFYDLLRLTMSEIEITSPTTQFYQDNQMTLRQIQNNYHQRAFSNQDMPPNRDQSTQLTLNSNRDLQPLRTRQTLQNRVQVPQNITRVGQASPQFQNYNQSNSQYQNYYQPNS